MFFSPSPDLCFGLLIPREELKFDGIGWEIMSIALPAALALAADPITSLVDTAFVGHLGTFIVSPLCCGLLHLSYYLFDFMRCSY